MSKMRLILVACLIFPLLSACVAKVQYSKVQSDLMKNQQRLEQITEKLEATKRELQECEKNRTESVQELQKTNLELSQNVKDLKSTNLRLTGEVEDLTLAMKKTNSIIQIQERVIELLDDTKKTIETSLKEQIATELIKIEEGEGRLKVSFTDKILFKSGSVTISEKGKKLLMKMATSVKKAENQYIVVEGHTDNVPTGRILQERFPTNWELSAARALAVVRFLQDQAHLNPEMLSACAYGSYRPLTSNHSAEGRRRNRRIEIILTPSR